MKDRTFKIWYIAIVVFAFGIMNLMLFNATIKYGNIAKWIGIIVNCFLMGSAAWRIATDHLELEKHEK